ncbi:MAG: ribosome small subunit-dependent GTPase A [Nocardioides sp.]
MLETVGFDEEVAGDFARFDAPDSSAGRVVRVDRGVVSVLTEAGPARVTLGGGVLATMAADPLDGPCTGDWVVLRSWPGERQTLEHVLPRRTAVVRSTAGRSSHGQVLCSNVDLVGVVVALHPEPVPAKVERLLALAWESGATPVVVLTKADLVGDADLVAEDVATLAPGAEVVVTSTVTGRGLERLRELIGHGTLALVGASGHGKSTLTNMLVGAEVLRTREIREDGRGRHTSVRRELVPLPGGGAVVDTPGLRGVGLLAVDAGLVRTFADIDALAEGCRFRDCGHGDEPGCAVAAAVADGSLGVRRFESWQRLRRELAWQNRRQDARMRSERRRARLRRPRETGTTHP